MKKIFLNELEQKLTAQKLRDEINQFIVMASNKQKQKEFNDEMVQKTWYYQKKYGFETNPRKGHEFWNVEADAFKHTFGSALMYFKYGNLGSTIGGIHHENSTPNNPYNEWNMDSWNNNKGREIAKEIEKEYGKNFYNMSQQKRDDIIALKVMDRMKKGELITNPNDTRKYNGFIENKARDIKNYIDNKYTGQAAPIDNNYTREMIGNMSSDEYLQHEPMIMEQLKTQGIPSEKQINQKNDLSGFVNEISGNSKIFTREEIKNMTTDEYLKNEKAIDYQLKTIGVPYEKDIKTKQNNSSNKSGNKKSSSSSNSGDGRWMTINGNHVFIDD